MRFKQKPTLSTDMKSDDKEQLAKDFLLKADKPATFHDDIPPEANDIAVVDNSKSWKDIDVQKDVTAFSFRIPKRDMQQLKFISKQTGMSLNVLCLVSIQANNRKMLKEIEDNQ